MNKLQGLLLIILAVLAGILAINFFSRPAPIEVSMAKVTVAMVEENQAKIQEENKRHQAAEAARKRAELNARMHHCEVNTDCIIVDQDPCGCLRGPGGVTAINSNFSLEFSTEMDKKYPNPEVCPSVASTEKECSRTARPVCVSNRCEIVY